MAIGATPIVITGNVTADPEQRQAGSATVTGLSVAVTARTKQGDEWVDGEPTFFRVSAWRELGDHVMASIHKGDRVIVSGTIEERKFTDKDGNERRTMEVTAEDVAPSLRFATAQVQRQQRNANQGQRQQQYAQQQRPQQQGQRHAPPPQQQSWGGYDENQPF